MQICLHQLYLIHFPMPKNVIFFLLLFFFFDRQEGIYLERNIPQSMGHLTEGKSSLAVFLKIQLVPSYSCSNSLHSFLLHSGLKKPKIPTQSPRLSGIRILSYFSIISYHSTPHHPRLVFSLSQKTSLGFSNSFLQLQSFPQAIQFGMEHYYDSHSL